MSSTDTHAAWTQRAAFFEEAARHTSQLAVDTEHGRFVVSTSDGAVGSELFTKRFLPELRALSRVTRALLSPEGRTFVDVGANIGTATVVALGEGFARAVALVPEPGTAALLRQNVALNDLVDRVDVISTDAPLDSLVAAGTLHPEEVGLVWVGVSGHDGQVLAGASTVLAGGAAVVTALGPEGLEGAQQHFTGFVDLRQHDETDGFDTQPIDTLERFVAGLTDERAHVLLLPRERAAAKPEKAKKAAKAAKAPKVRERFDQRLRDAARQRDPVELRRDIARTQKQLERLDRMVGSRVVTRLESLERDVASVQRRLAVDAASLPYPERLLAHRFRLHSQNQEDGVLLALLEAAGVGPRRFVELGCGDNGGNSGMLAGELGFEGLMVDGADSNVAACRRQFPRATVEQAWIERETVDALVTSHGCGGEVDLRSVDIDGNDIYVWDALTSVRPRIAIAEYNSLMGPEAPVTIAYDPAFVMSEVEGADRGYYGASLTALTRSMAKRGMRLVTTDFRGVNAFFLRDDLAPQIPAQEPPRVFRRLEKHQRMIDRGYDLVRVCRELGLELVPYE